MIINIRYYVVMMASVFLALGVGIFIGFTLDGQEIFVEHQQGLISELELRFVELKQENGSLQSMVDLKEKELLMHRDLAGRILPALIKDSLAGLKIAIIQSNNESVYTGMMNSLNKAGAVVTSTTFIGKEYMSQNPQKTLVLRDSLDEFVESSDLCPYVSGRLVNAILTGGDEKFIGQLKDLGMIDVSGEYNGEVDYFILAGDSFAGEPDLMERLEIPIINAIKNCNIPVVGVEKTSCKQSCIKHYKDFKISSVDNIDNIIGQYSLIKVLQGNEGHYGVKDTADALIPD